ncbi:MAG: Ldh family oxidoreductase [Candidatus Omnitrophica bacterium]|nr:Ldh family oxidoreductase [Candidatus Omnitrophota bacterium]MCB9720107.1 Ldh family oxidoreductase [Candidatus Omnitrophota bacterium]
MGSPHCYLQAADLHRLVRDVCRRTVSVTDADLIAAMIVQSEQMGVSSHGLHYFLHTIFPLVRARLITTSRVATAGNVLQSDGSGGVGYRNTRDCLKKGSALARKMGSAIITFKNPGKVGALRIYCQPLMDAGQLIIMLKNTAATVGLRDIPVPLIGTNPLCIGLPDTKFVYDSSISSVATNKVRVAKKGKATFTEVIGISKSGNLTRKPKPILKKEGYLLPFSYNGYAYKAFYLGVVIECLAAMAGGKTGARVGEKKGRRLFSDEGMLAIIIDKKAFPNYTNYHREMPLLFKDLGKYKLRLPGAYTARKRLRVLRRDYEELTRL